MRFLLKIGLLLLAVSYFLPAPPEGAMEDRPGLSPVVMLYGLQQAVTDVAGFCTRSPAACASARDALGYAAERVAAAAASLTALATGTAPPPPAAPEPAVPHAYPPPSGYRAPLVTGAIRPAAAAPAPAASPVPAPQPRPAPRPALASAEPFRMPAVAEGGPASARPRPASDVPGGTPAAARPVPAG